MVEIIRDIISKGLNCKFSNNKYFTLNPINGGIPIFDNIYNNIIIYAILFILHKLNIFLFINSFINNICIV